MTELLAAGDGSENYAVRASTGIVYVAGNDGVLRGYDGTTGQLVSSWHIGNDLDAIAISPNGQYALVTEATPVSFVEGADGNWPANETVAAVYKVNLATGETTTLTYTNHGSDYTFADVAFTDNGHAIISQNILPGWSGWAPLVTLDLQNNTFATTGSYYAGLGYAASLTQAKTTGDILLGQLGLSSAEYYLIDSAGQQDGNNGIYENGVYGYAAGVEAFYGTSASGFIAIVTGGGFHLYDGNFNYIANLADTYAFLANSPGLTFSNDGTKLYAIDPDSDRIVTINTGDLSLTNTFAIGNYDYNVLQWGEELTLSPDQTVFFVNTTHGIVTVDNLIETLGTAGNDLMEGTAGKDWLNGLAGDDILYGFDGNDLLVGDAGNDLLVGGAGADKLVGGNGDDTYRVDDAFDTIVEGIDAGNDTVDSYTEQVVLSANVENLNLMTGAVTGIGNDENNVIAGNAIANSIYGRGGDDILLGNGGADELRGQAGADSLYGGGGNDALFGGAGNDALFGDQGSDRLYGNGGDDALYGGGLNDTLIGGAGNDNLNGSVGADLLNGQTGDDLIVGGPGIDTLVGGLGADRFLFGEGHLGAGLSVTDRITDFSQSDGDVIDFHNMDADTTTAGNQAFSWIGADAFSSTAGELRAEIVGNTTYIYGDTNGDGTANFVLWLTGQIDLQATDFVL
ncbi:calcium-binding protein [Tsuneonella mangrovi]|uniref:calcium-binding protein n=1 Tax=Tsuneonella mangrovi TaxID=1982042 RepID=UPI000BA2AD64|nr:calcium-binding protein [Tsuneonella mangrovi]